jgi:PKD repeat protein
MRHLGWLGLLVTVAIGCSNSNSDSRVDAGPDDDERGAPVAAFTASTLRASEGEPVVFDASSSSPAGLTFGWDFGDGVRGGGVRIAPR